MSVIIDGGAGITFPDTVQQTNALTNTGGAPPYFAARAWVIFDGSSREILAASNVSSVTDISTGIHRVNFTVAMPSTSYCVLCSAQRAGSENNIIASYGSLLTSSVRIFTFTVGNTYNNPTTVSVVVFR